MDGNKVKLAGTREEYCIHVEVRWFLRGCTALIFPLITSRIFLPTAPRSISVVICKHVNKIYLDGIVCTLPKYPGIVKYTN